MAINQPPPQLPPYPGFQPMPTPPPPPREKPPEINVIAGLALASGILNVLGAIVYFVLVALGALASLGFGCLCLPVFFPLLILGIAEIVYASRLFGLPHSGARISIPIAVLEIVAILYLNFVSLASGIVALILQGNSKVGSYFAYLDALEYPPDPYARR